MLAACFCFFAACASEADKTDQKAAAETAKMDSMTVDLEKGMREIKTKAADLQRGVDEFVTTSYAKNIFFKKRTLNWSRFLLWNRLN